MQAASTALSALTAVSVHGGQGGSGADYAGVFIACVATWVGLSGIGEAALIAAAIAAAAGHLDLGLLLIVAWTGAMAGGAAGWLAGRKAGRRLLAARGPLLRVRREVTSLGDRLYERFGLIAVLLAPSWIAGMHRMSAVRFLGANALAAVAWTLAVGLGAYALGPHVAGAVADERLASVVIVAAAVAAIAAVIVRRRHSRE